MYEINYGTRCYRMFYDSVCYRHKRHLIKCNERVHALHKQSVIFIEVKKRNQYWFIVLIW